MAKAFIIIILPVAIVVVLLSQFAPSTSEPVTSTLSQLLRTASPNPAPTPATKPVPVEKTLSNSYHIFQSFNNCGPAALSMALSYFDINVSQTDLGRALRPFQNTQGDNDDKSVTLAELAAKAPEYGLLAYHRPGGSIELVKQFINEGLPVITRTWLKPNEDIGHFRIIKGYSDNTNSLIQDDSLQGKNLSYTYEEFNTLWSKFNFEYLVLVPKEKQREVEQILGPDVDLKNAWERALISSQQALNTNPNDMYLRFNYSIALFHTGELESSITEYEKVASSLPFRTLWYQIEPIKAYFELGRYDDVFRISDQILNNNNRAYSELYLIRGDIYKLQGNTAQARSEYEKAVFYNQNMKAAKDALNSL